MSVTKGVNVPVSAPDAVIDTVPLRVIKVDGVTDEITVEVMLPEGIDEGGGEV